MHAVDVRDPDARRDVRIVRAHASLHEHLRHVARRHRMQLLSAPLPSTRHLNHTLTREPRPEWIARIMGREVRRVPPTWQHPKNEHGRYVPLLDGSELAKRMREWDEGADLWRKREYHLTRTYMDAAGYEDYSFAEYCGERPDPADYTPAWPPEEATHLQMYETCSEGTPISPPCATPEELARWLADNDASAFGGMTATYEQWLGTCRSGWAPSAIMSPRDRPRVGRRRARPHPSRPP